MRIWPNLEMNLSTGIQWTCVAQEEILLEII